MTRPFINRTEELKQLQQALRYNGQETPVLVFTGIGGMGKTALRSAFEEKILKPKGVPYAVLDYDGDPNLRPIEATLRAFRRQLGKHKVKTPLFDYLYARYFELSTGMKLSNKNFPLELEGVINILEGLPFVSNVTQIIHGLTQLGLVTQDRLKHKEWLYRIRELEPREFLNLLPEVLADDLEEAMSIKSPKMLKSSEVRTTLIIDAYERISESQLDDYLHRRLLLLTPHLLRIIFTRDSLPWEHKFPKEWKGKILHIPPLDDLIPEDANLFLKKKKIMSPELQDHIYELTGGFPLHLELCADIYAEIKKSTGREPLIQDFEGATEAEDLTEELVNRLLRQLKDDERDLMRLAVYPRWVTEESLEELSSVPESVERIFKRFIKLSMYSPHPEIPNAYVIRKEVRSFLLEQQREKHLWKRYHGKLAKFHKERWQETQAPYYFREAIYHRFYENAEEAMKMFEEHFWKLLEKFHFGEAESLLGSVPEETLSKEQKRKVKYARARLLTSTMHSQQSLLTAQKLYELIIESEIEEKLLSEYIFYLGKLLFHKAEYKKALEYFRKSLAIRLKIYGAGHPYIATTYNNIGMVYREQGEYENSLEYLRKSLAIRLKVYGEEYSDVAESYNNIGVVYDYQGTYRKALEYYQKSVAIYLKIFKDEHPAVASVYINIGIIYVKQGKYDKALEYFQKSLTTSLKIHGEEHPTVGSLYHNIAIIYRKKSDYKNALAFHHKSLSIRLKTYGEKHPDVADSFNSIGNLYCQKGEYEKAIVSYQKSVTIYLKIFKAEHPDVAGSYHNIGNIYSGQGEYGKALEYYQKALVIRLKLYGNEHLDVARVYHNIGYVYSEQAENAKALEYSQKALVIYKKVYGEEHPDIAGIYNNIGSIYKNQSEYKKALEYYQKSLDMRLNIYGKEHPKVAASYNNIGTIYKERGEFVKAMEYHTKALAIRLKVYGEKHPQVATSYDNIGNVYCEQGKYRKALEYYNKTLTINLKVYGEKHPDVAICYYNVGCTYFAQAEYEKALKFYQKGFNILLKVFREEHPDIAESYEGIASTLWALKREDEAFEKINQSIDIYRKFKLWKDTMGCLETLAGWLEEKGRKKEAEEARAEVQKIRNEYDHQSNS